jgi:hypothetical protein
LFLALAGDIADKPMQYLYWLARWVLDGLAGSNWNSHLLKTLAHCVLVWLTALCVLVQSTGATAGVLCVGCVDSADSWGGVSLSSAPCAAASDCCDSHSHNDAPRLPGDGDSDGDDCDPCDSADDCGCVDVKLSPNASAVSRPPVKFVLSLPHWLMSPPAALVNVEAVGVADARHGWGARAGPLSVRLLVPLARQTVLLI